jgi:ParB family chromosome partitioning protein
MASTGKSTFRRRSIEPSAVAAAEGAAAGAPIVGDPRMAAPPAPQGFQPGQGEEVVARQLSNGKAPTYVVGQAQVGMTYEVPLSLITSSPMPARAFYPPEMVDKMGHELTTEGQLTPASGYINDAGGVTLIEGETRLRAARSLSWPTLRVEMREKPADSKKLYKLGRDANKKRNDSNLLDDAVLWKRMLADKVYESQQEIATDMELGKELVSRIIQLSAMPQRVINTLSTERELLDNLRLLTAIREFCEVKGEDDTVVLIAEVVSKGLGYRDVTKMRQAAEKGPTKKPRAISEAVHFHGVKGELKSFDKDGRLELVIKGLTESDLADLMGKIRALFPKTEGAVHG